MKSLKMAFGLVVVAGLMAVVASPSMALGPRWVTCVSNPGHGHFNDSHCLTPEANGNWETKEVSATTEVTSSTVPGTKGLELEDSKAGTAITCVGRGTGTAGANGTDSVVTIKATECKFVTGKNGSCEASKPVTLSFRNLGWSTRLEERGSGSNAEVRDVITSLVAGKAPGYAVECTVGGIFKVTDTCEGVISTHAIANRAEGTVETIFDKTSEEEKGTCSVGGANSWRVSGELLNRLRSTQLLWILATAIKT